MHTVTAYVARSPDACWRVFTDAALLPAWVPGLRRARVIATGPEGLAAEILFEFLTSLTYSLVYTYDRAACEVRWEPRAGKRDAVRGLVRFEPFDEGARISYSLEQGDGRSPAHRAIGDAQALVDSFVRWMADEK